MKKHLLRFCTLILFCVLITGITSYASTQKTFNFVFGPGAMVAYSDAYIKDSNKSYAVVTIANTNLKKGETAKFYLCDQTGKRVTDVVTYTGKSKNLVLKYQRYALTNDKSKKRMYRLVGYCNVKYKRMITGKMVL